MKLTLTSRIRKSDDQVSCDLNGEVAILNLKTALYFGLDPVGAVVWNALEEPASATELADAIMARFDVGQDQCRSDLLDLLNRMHAAGLIEVTGETAT